MKRPNGLYCAICVSILKIPGIRGLLECLDYPLCIHKADPCEVRK